MARRKADSPGLGRILDSWVPPSNAGVPVGCFATSFTFDSVFFEEECLARFAGIRSGSTAEDKGLEWIVEREERLSQITAVTLIDKTHCRGPRSPRWDLLCARSEMRSGILHAKLSLLIWARHLRLVVASANLTPQGYRRNREIFISLEAGQDLALDRQAWNEALDYLESLLPLGGSADHPAVNRAGELIVAARARVKALAPKAPEPESTVRFHGMGPGRPDLFGRLSKHWQEGGGVVRDIYAVSPFFDPADVPAGKTSQRLWGLGSERGEVCLHLSAPMVKDGKKKVVIQAPKAWGVAPRNSATVKIYGVEEEDTQDKERRPLHAKLIGLENETWALMAVGSSNLTQAGSGISAAPNWEAMASVLIRADRQKEEFGIINAAWEKVSGELVEEPVFQGAAEDLETEAEGTITVLPMAFQRAIYRRVGNGAEIEITLVPGALPGWNLQIPGGERLAGEAEWQSAGHPKNWVLPWSLPAAPSGLEVCWPELPPAWLPVCAFDGTHLPPPAELRNLPLELLIQVLTTARPLAQTVASYLRHKGNGPEAIENDPHKRVDVSGYLIPKTRRISLALAALRDRLAEPAATREALRWRLEGPFGALAVVDAVEREAHGADEKAFFIAELCIELAQARPRESEGCVPAAQQLEAIRSFIDARVEAARPWLKDTAPGLKRYVEKAFKHALEPI